MKTLISAMVLVTLLASCSQSGKVKRPSKAVKFAARSIVRLNADTYMVSNTTIQVSTTDTVYHHGDTVNVNDNYEISNKGQLLVILK